jgi:hypothetical protein
VCFTSIQLTRSASFYIFLNFMPTALRSWSGPLGQSPSFRRDCIVEGCRRNIRRAGLRTLLNLSHPAIRLVDWPSLVSNGSQQRAARTTKHFMRVSAQLRRRAPSNGTSRKRRIEEMNAIVKDGAAGMDCTKRGLPVNRTRQERQTKSISNGQCGGSTARRTDRS